ncbi:MAG TPA: 4'-phosphopantetheinyl transferase superfamily protein [Pseudohongiella sp.]|nr:4'-phosphopantetheinyl transferase superfamily protein [Pseudohongiella sp.]HEA63088.1 4'-phosphopantetheinyl transferase superfamily protein [Pseudohongiella sp.]
MLSCNATVLFENSGAVGERLNHVTQNHHPGMLSCSIPAKAVQQTSIMIRQLSPPLAIDSDCYQVSCHFDRTLFHDETANQLGLILPAKMDSAVQKRKAEFLAGRYCARAALAQLDSNLDAAVGIGANRVPLWPPGLVGSITHSHCYASAVVARQQHIRAVGLDSETWIKKSNRENVSSLILTPSETRSGQIQLFDSPLHFLTLVFSAKESLFKCLFPLVNRFFDFQAAIISPLPSGSASGGKFRFELLEDLDTEFRAGYSGYGTYAMDATGVHTAIVLRAQTRD